jgi:hypothetical protein
MIESPMGESGKPAQSLKQRGSPYAVFRETLL